VQLEEAMNHLTAEGPTLDWLRGVVEPVEIRDPGGKLLGRYVPVLTPEEKEAYAKVRAMIDPAEVRRRILAEHGKGKPLEEVLEYLQSLESPDAVHGNLGPVRSESTGG
jgi:hypothetical protein